MNRASLVRIAADGAVFLSKDAEASAEQAAEDTWRASALSPEDETEIARVTAELREAETQLRQARIAGLPLLDDLDRDRIRDLRTYSTSGFTRAAYDLLGELMLYILGRFVGALKERTEGGKLRVTCDAVCDPGLLRAVLGDVCEGSRSP